MIPDGTKVIYVNTGNLINCKELNRRAIQSPTEEAYECLSFTLRSWFLANASNIQESEVLYCVNPAHVVKMDNEERSNLKITVKAFLHCFDGDSLVDAMEKVMNSLAVDSIDSIILALPSSRQEEWTIEQIQPLWCILENFIKIGKVLSIGISDLDKAQLTELYNWAKVKPSINQVNLDSCCVMPPEMTAFAKDNDIQLLTHSDPKDLIPQEMFEAMINKEFSTTAVWNASWIMRYSVVVKGRGIIQNKGYLLCAKKDDAINGPC